jgi:hypothetical protein
MVTNMPDPEQRYVEVLTNSTGSENATDQFHESHIPEFKKSTLAMITAQRGIVGWCADSRQVLAAIEVSSRSKVIDISIVKDKSFNKLIVFLILK